MQGTGNDYIFINCFREKVEDPSALARKLSDRHFGIGSDGLILIGPSEKADFMMSVFNADGSQAQMCGTGIRCLGKYVFERGMTGSRQLRVETLGGVREIYLNEKGGIVASVTVDMGRPVLEPSEIPVDVAGDRAVSVPLLVSGVTYNVTCVSMGNPHVVVFLDEIDYLVLTQLGPRFERHEAFPRRTNAEFVRIISNDKMKMRVWERGVGETLACGTGACASVVAGALNGYCGKKVAVTVKGGQLDVEWSDDGRVYLTGDAVQVFDGELQ